MFSAYVFFLNLLLIFFHFLDMIPVLHPGVFFQNIIFSFLAVPHATSHRFLPWEIVSHVVAVFHATLIITWRALIGPNLNVTFCLSTVLRWLLFVQFLTDFSHLLALWQIPDEFDRGECEHIYICVCVCVCQPFAHCTICKFLSTLCLLSML